MVRGSLHLITSGRQSLEEVLEVVMAAAQGGIDYLHIREKERTAQELLSWVSALAEAFPRERIIVNDRVDVAAACGLRGAHLAYHSLPPHLAKRVLSANQWAGRSVHSLAEAQEAHEQGADYLLYGHVYDSQSKPGLAPRGLEEVKMIAKRLPLPVIAVGGIQPHHVAEVLEAGCAGIAVISGIMAAGDPREAARKYRLELDHYFAKRDG